MLYTRKTIENNQNLTKYRENIKEKLHETTNEKENTFVFSLCVTWLYS